jgi:hypothetical protein
MTIILTSEQKQTSKYYTPNEVAVHNTSDDIWVSYLGKVYDLTKLVAEHKSDPLIKPIIAVAGKDITHWFDANTGDLRSFTEPQTGLRQYYTPHGRFVHVPPSEPSAEWAMDFGKPWWKDQRYELGILSKKTRNIRIVNTLTSQEHTIEICGEETLNQILERYLPYNKHAGSYTWKYDSKGLDMTGTLEDNCIVDDEEDLDALCIDPEQWTPAIHLYFNDDLTEA